MVGAQQMRQRWLEELLVEVILLWGVSGRDRRDECDAEEHGQDYQTNQGASVSAKTLPHHLSVSAIISALWGRHREVPAFFSLTGPYRRCAAPLRRMSSHFVLDTRQVAAQRR